MPSLTVLAGLPGAGKSTLARTLATQTGAMVVSRDALRLALHDRADQNTLSVIVVVVARALLEAGADVIVDACHLHPADLRAWTQVALEVAATLTWRTLDTPLAQCIAQDAQRDDPVGADRIRAMAE